MKIKEFLQSIQAKLNIIKETSGLAYDNSVDLISTNQLSSLLKDLPYLPYTESSLRFSSITYLLNDIVINNRKCIVEFGSGISTICIAKLIQQLNLKDITVFSVDNNQEWLDIISGYLNGAIDQDKFNLIHADLCKNGLSLGSNSWYNISALEKLNDYKGKVDCVVIDGPEAWYKDIELSRYPALPYIYEYLTENCSIFLDDTNRCGEQLILNKWKQNFDFNHQKLNRTFTRLFRGSSFNIK